MADRSFAPIDVILWTKVLRGIYEKFQSMDALMFALEATRNMWNQCAEIRLKIDDTLAPSQLYHLEQPMKEFARFYSRVLFYYHHFNDPPEDVKKFVLDPLLYGRFHPDFPEPLFEPTWRRRKDGWVIARPDVTQIAMIHNQLVRAMEYFEPLRAWWDVERRGGNWLAELLMAAKRHVFEESAPGDPPNLREQLSDDIDEMVKSTKEMFKGAGAAGLFGIAALAVAGLTFAALHAAD